jgi:hypothetical protein
MKAMMDKATTVCILTGILCGALLGNVKAGVCFGGAVAGIYTIVVSKTVKKL